MAAKPAPEDEPADAPAPAPNNVADEAELLSEFAMTAKDANTWHSAYQILVQNAANTELRRKLANYQESRHHKLGPSPLEYVPLHFLDYNCKEKGNQ